jgi:hypothetical protein
VEPPSDTLDRLIAWGEANPPLDDWNELHFPTPLEDRGPTLTDVLLEMRGEERQL